MRKRFIFASTAGGVINFPVFITCYTVPHHDGGKVRPCGRFPDKRKRPFPG